MVLAVFLLIAVGAVMALSFNAGHGVAVRGELQNAVDSAALAGVRELNGTLAAVNAARSSANNFAQRHVTDPTISVAPQQIEFGNFDPATRTWTSFAPTVANLYRLNAIRVVAAREAGAPGGGALTAFFGSAFLNRDSFAVNAEAIAYAGSACPTSGSSCNSPFVIRYGCLVRGDVRCDADYYVGLSSATIDSAGLSDMDPRDDINGNPSANSPDICRGLTNPTETTCTMGASEVRTTNGTSLNSSAGPCGGRTICEVIQARYPPGSTMRVPVVIYDDGDASTCADGQYGGVGTIVSSIEMRVDGVRCSSGDTGVLGPCAFATGNCVKLHTLCDDTAQQPGACVALGVVTENPVLGR